MDWGPPSSDGGTSITDYKVRWKENGGEFNDWMSVGTDAIFSFSDVEPGTVFTFEVRAENRIGYGAAATITFTALRRPDPPTGLEAAPGDEQVKLSWTASASDGGSPIPMHHVRRKAGSGLYSVWVGIPNSAPDGDNATSYTVTRLDNGTEYTFQVRAEGPVVVGNSPASNAASATPMAATASVSGVRVTNITQNGATATVTIANPDGSSQTVHLRYRTTAAGGTEAGAWSPTQTATTTTASVAFPLSGLTAGTEYEVQASLDSSFPSDARVSDTFTTLTDTVATDRAALVALYNATGGANWTNSTNWLTNEALSEWYGVTTDENGRVTALDLYDNELSGSIPEELGDLTSLQRLSLHRNGLSGEIPAELGDLANLQELYLYDNQLTGEIPAALGDLANLQELSLSRNMLTGEIPAELGGLANLQYLYLYDNQLTGEIPAELGNLSNLQELWLYDNTLSGVLPLSLSGLPQLSVLYIQSTTLCAPTDAAFQAWLATIDFQGAVCGPPATVPDAPTDLTATATDSTRIDLSWTAPTDTGGADISGYRIEVSSDGGSSFTNLVADTGSTATTYAHTGLPAGTTRHYRVSAINAVGTGTPSNVADATTPTVPDAPTNLRATTGNGQVVLMWDAPASDGGAAIIRYEYRVGASGPWTSIGVAATVTVENLTNGTAYSFQVRAVNAVGDGAAAVTTATPTGVVPQVTITGPASVREGDKLTITVHRTGATATELRGGIDFEDTAGDGDFDIGVAFVIRVDSATKTVGYTVPSDGVNADDRTITAEVTTGYPTYEAGNPSSVTVAVIDEDAAAADRDALVAFYNATGGANWTNSTNWLTNKALSEWDGVTTDANGRVTSLDLSPNNLVGTIPAELGDLTSLQTLWLHSNELSGEIPAALGDLANLQHAASLGAIS